MGSGRGNRTSAQVCSCKPSRDVDTSLPPPEAQQPRGGRRRTWEPALPASLMGDSHREGTQGLCYGDTPHK